MVFSVQASAAAHVLAVASPNRRVKCVVACNPWIAGFEIVRSGAGLKSIQGFTELVQYERRNLLEGKESTLMSSVAWRMIRRRNPRYSGTTRP